MVTTHTHTHSTHATFLHRALNLGFSELACESIFHQADDDQNGAINYQEFLHSFRAGVDAFGKEQGVMCVVVSVCAVVVVDNNDRRVRGWLGGVGVSATVKFVVTPATTTTTTTPPPPPLPNGMRFPACPALPFFLAGIRSTTCARPRTRWRVRRTR
jgi:hypothetical protein